MSKDKVIYIPGTVKDNKGNPINTQREAWKKEADCGCGINCYDNTIRLKADDGKDMVLYIREQEGSYILTVVSKEEYENTQDDGVQQ